MSTFIKITIKQIICKQEDDILMADFMVVECIEEKVWFLRAQFVIEMMHQQFPVGIPETKQSGKYVRQVIFAGSCGPVA